MVDRPSKQTSPKKHFVYGQRKDKIVEAAIVEFSLFGFAGTTMRKVGERAGVNHQLIVHHFQNMDGLWRAAMTRLAEEADALTQQTVQQIGVADEKVVLEAFIDAIVTFAVKRPEAFRIMIIETAADSDRFAWFVDVYVKRLFDTFRTCMTSAQRAGVAAKGDVGTLYYALIGVATSSFTQANENAMLTSSNPFREQAIEDVRTLCRRVLGVTSGAPDQPR